jgi:hypothetical protein
LLDAPIDAHFAAFRAGVGKADDASSSGASEEGKDVQEVAIVHERAAGRGVNPNCKSRHFGCKSARDKQSTHIQMDKSPHRYISK